MTSEESETPDVVELARRFVEAADRRDFDGMMSFYARDAVWDASPVGLGTFDGVDAIRDLVEDWIGGYEDFSIAVEESLDLGNGVSFGVYVQRARLVGSSDEVRVRFAGVVLWREDKVLRVALYLNVDQARAIAARLAESRR